MQSSRLPRATSAAAPGAATRARLRVATFNIRNGRAFDWLNSWPLRRHATRTMIDALDADVVGLQEVYAFQLRWLRRRLPDYDAVSAGRQRGDRGERCPVLWKPSVVRLAEWRTQWYGHRSDRPGVRLEGARFPRIATITTFEAIATGTLIQLANTHLDERHAENRRRSLEQLVAGLDVDRPTIVLGDLNALPGDREIGVLRTAGLRDAVASGAPGTAHDFTGSRDGRRIDHIFVSRHWDVVDARVVLELPTRRLPSDHWPVLAELEARKIGAP